MPHDSNGSCRSLLCWKSFVWMLATLGLASHATADSSLPAETFEEVRDDAPVADFALRDFRGKEHALSDYADRKLVVVAFLGVECPLAKLYSRRLARLHDAYREQSVAFLAIDSNQQDSLSEMANFARQHEIPFPFLKDGGNEIADQLGAERTPQVFLLDGQRIVRYVGAIDDQYGIGYQRGEATQAYLKNAIDALLANQAVEIPSTTPIGCKIGRLRNTQPTGAITFTKHIAPLLNRRCVECHRAGEIGPFPLTSYDEVAGWEAMMLEVVEENRMPPWFANPAHGEFRNDARLTSEEKELLKTWVANGCPEGDPADLPAPPEFVEGWRIDEPDQVIAMDDQSFEVPAEGVVDYQYFVVDPGWEEDRYVVAAEARPGNRAVVHHIIAYLIPPGAEPSRDHRRAMLVGYAPGSPPNLLTDGRAMRVRAGTKLLFELHYTPNGTAQSDLSRVGLVFAERDDVKELVVGRAPLNHKFAIPPHAENHPVVAEYTAKRDELLLRMNPHMHLRGKSFRFEAVYPDGRQEILLDVPRYDFNWQLSYELSEPKYLPTGTKIICTAHYDNSEANLANPDPTKEIRWGEQSWDEMMIGFFDVIRVQKDSESAQSTRRNDPGDNATPPSVTRRPS